MIVERELTLQKKVRLCEASLEDSGLIIDNPPSSSITPGKFLRLVDSLSTFSLDDKERLERELGGDVAKIVLSHWESDQRLTPNSPQVALATRQPFPMVAIVMVQSGFEGSTYITHPPPPPAHRFVLAEPFFKDEGVTFLKTYWVINKHANS
jgi:hypothetical protein